MKEEYEYENRRGFTSLETKFCECFYMISNDVNRNAREKGFWDKDRNFGEMVALVHSELSEALEAHRKPGTVDKHLPDHNPVAVEFADAIIRIMDLAIALELDIPEAMIAKIKFNKTRERMHGKGY